MNPDEPENLAPRMYLDPHEKPPEALKAIFKLWKNSQNGIPVKDESQLSSQPAELSSPTNSLLSPQNLERVFSRFLEFERQTGDNSDRLQDSHRAFDGVAAEIEQCKAGFFYDSVKIQGLMILPSFIPPTVQKQLLSRLLHRDLSNPEHKTNLHMHYDVCYPSLGQSFFACAKDRTAFKPKDARLHGSLSILQALDKKLRWMTLGGQYDWTTKLYPTGEAPAFPEDIRALIQDLLPAMEPQAAIVNIYSPGNTLSLHRDVSEEVHRGLVSISLGCDAIFVIGINDEMSGHTQYELLRLRSGDALFMTGQSRYAWHGVARIIPNTCPSYLEGWPGGQFKGWMKNKRINLNVRQMR